MMPIIPLSDRAFVTLLSCFFLISDRLAQPMKNSAGRAGSVTNRFEGMGRHLNILVFHSLCCRVPFVEFDLSGRKV
jgi:hypothetical protein